VIEPPQPSWAQPLESSQLELLADSLGITADTLRDELRRSITAAQLGNTAPHPPQPDTPPDP
jgi:hypothetical protein